MDGLDTYGTWTGMNKHGRVGSNLKAICLPRHRHAPVRAAPRDVSGMPAPPLVPRRAFLFSAGCGSKESCLYAWRLWLQLAALHVMELEGGQQRDQRLAGLLDARG